MRTGTRPHTDPIDAVLGHAPLDEDLADVAAIVHDVRSAYLPAAPLRRQAPLAALTEGHRDSADALTTAGAPVPANATGSSGAPGHARAAPLTRDVGGDPAPQRAGRALRAVAGALATVTGKLLLGATVAAASVGGLHAVDVIHVPPLPNVTEPGGPTEDEDEDDRDVDHGDDDMDRDSRRTPGTGSASDATDRRAGSSSDRPDGPPQGAHPDGPACDTGADEAGEAGEAASRDVGPGAGAPCDESTRPERPRPGDPGGGPGNPGPDSPGGAAGQGRPDPGAGTTPGTAPENRVPPPPAQRSGSAPGDGAPSQAPAPPPPDGGAPGGDAGRDGRVSQGAEPETGGAARP